MPGSSSFCPAVAALFSRGSGVLKRNEAKDWSDYISVKDGTVSLDVAGICLRNRDLKNVLSYLHEFLYGYWEENWYCNVDINLARNHISDQGILTTLLPFLEYWGCRCLDVSDNYFGLRAAQALRRWIQKSGGWNVRVWGLPEKVPRNETHQWGQPRGYYCNKGSKDPKQKVAPTTQAPATKKKDPQDSTLKEKTLLDEFMQALARLEKFALDMGIDVPPPEKACEGTILVANDEIKMWIAEMQLAQEHYPKREGGGDAVGENVQSLSKAYTKFEVDSLARGYLPEDITVRKTFIHVAEARAGPRRRSLSV